MQIGEDFETEEGVATYLGDVALFVVFVHVAKIPADEISEVNAFNAEIDICPDWNLDPFLSVYPELCESFDAGFQSGQMSSEITSIKMLLSVNQVV